MQKCIKHNYRLYFQLSTMSFSSCNRSNVVSKNWHLFFSILIASVTKMSGDNAPVVSTITETENVHAIIVLYNAHCGTFYL